MILIADSGSTKTDWCVTLGSRIIHRVSTQGINPFHQDAETISAVINSELLPRLSSAGEGFRTDDITAIYFYGSGCRAECEPMMRRTLRDIFFSATVVEAHSDLLGAARAVCGAGEGIACILGTGANSCLYDGQNIVMNTPPMGYILGDEGSGAVLGKLFINALFKERLSHTVLDTFTSETGLTLPEVIRRVYREPLANRFLASLAPFIHAHKDEPLLRELIIGNFRDFFRCNVRRYDRPYLPVGAVGSIAFHFAGELTEAAAAEGFKPGRIIKSPMDGLVAFHS